MTLPSGERESSRSRIRGRYGYGLVYGLFGLLKLIDEGVDFLKDKVGELNLLSLKKLKVLKKVRSIKFPSLRKRQ